jgi:outer membrane protein assembly factor BamB
VIDPPVSRSTEPRSGTVSYPGGIRVAYRWAGSGGGDAVFALSEAGGTLTDHGPLAGPDHEALCRAELRVETPAGPWTARLASRIYDEPAGLLWDSPGLLVIAYGFHTYGFDARTGELRWSHRSATPILTVLGSSRLDHVLVSAEIETFAIDAAGEVAWRIAHSDVVAEAALVGGRLVLTSYTGEPQALDPVTGRPAG